MKLVDLPEPELVSSGHMACAGCGAALAMRYALKGLGKKTIFTIPAGCWAVFDGPFPFSSLKVPMFHTALETTAAVASGIKAGLRARHDNQTTVVGWAGDGGTADIGFQALSSAAERNEDIIFFCYDNEAYMNTGIQRSSATPEGAWTTTTPTLAPKKGPKKDLIALMAAHYIPYAASASLAYPEDMLTKIKKALTIKGFRFISIFSPCPAGWRTNPSLTVQLARMGVQSRIFPLYEVTEGRHYNLTVQPRQIIPVEDYLDLQGRFKHLNLEAKKQIQQNVDLKWQELLNKCG